ncbi:hypothetical protein C1H87_16280 [Flavivirga eckloniae]|uniref:Uncharacterized protein n=1 Tax=Flavivirga eckloniae TaxID=1803846 RepID=A0A2K9PSZ3_9FLAO|nr:hypothetical protein C1H87_16280 [Flavivirga eckloniae]
MLTLQNDSVNSVTWSVLSNLVLVSSNNTSATIRFGSSPGSGFVRASFNGMVLTQNVTFGPPPLSITVQGSGPFGQLNVNDNGSTAPYKFYKNGLYILKITSGEINETHQIIVK